MGQPINQNPYLSSILGATGAVVAAGASAVAEIVRRDRETQLSALAAPDRVQEPLFDEDAALLRRRAQIGATQADTLLDPAVLVVRRINRSDNSVRFFRENFSQLLSGARGLAFQEVEGDVLFATDQFILQQVNESDEERLGPQYSFGRPKISCVGRSPRIYTYGGHLIDTERDGSGKALWLEAYDRYLRGSKCVQNDAFVDLYYRDQIRRGFLLHTNMTEGSNEPNRAQFAFSMFVIDERSDAVRADDLGLPEGVDNG